MERFVNGVKCDSFAYLDDKSTGETISFDLTGRVNFNLIIYLFADGKPFPLDESLDIECCVTTSRLDQSATKTIVVCSVGSHGEIILPIPPELRTPAIVFGEIRVSGTDQDNNAFFYKASDFRIAIIL